MPAQKVAQQRGLPADDAVGALEDEDISEIFLENLKAATPWIIKKANIRILTAFAESTTAIICSTSPPTSLTF